jgi:hypothetical protein
LTKVIHPQSSIPFSGLQGWVFQGTYQEVVICFGDNACAGLILEPGVPEKARILVGFNKLSNTLHIVVQK